MEKVVWDLKSQFDPQESSVFFDCMIAEFLLSEGRFIHSQEAVMKKYAVETISALAEKQKEKLAALPKLERLFYDIEMPLVKVLWKMEKTGVHLNTNTLRKTGDEINQAIENTEKELKIEMGSEINLNSSIQVGNFLAEKAGVPLSRTKTGRYATNENEIAQFADQFPIIQHLLTYRELSKLRSTYVESLIGKVDAEGKIHTTYNQVAVNTGRLSSSNPNLQNIPVTSLLGQQIKACFEASPGKTLVSFDYSQQELRILAHLTGEEKLIDAFNNNRDVHKTTASQLFSVDYGAVTKDQRSVAKTINFGIIYGMSSYGMSSGLNIPVEDAQTFIDTFYATYPKIRAYYDNYLKQGRIDGYVETLLGRRRYVFEFPGQKFIDNGMRRVLMNYPIQGTAADLMKKAMVEVFDKILATDQSVQLLLQVHDDLVFEVDDTKEAIEQVTTKVRDIMCHVYPLSVPVEVDVKIGKTWGTMEKIA